MTTPAQRMDSPVADNGYAWWYIDGVSDDGHTAVTAIVFVGSVFSPWYFDARRSGPTDPLQHAAINVSIRSHGRHFWVMNEGARPASARSAAQFSVTPTSTLAWQNGQLVLDFDEVTRPFFQRMPARIAGRLTLTPQLRHDATVALDAAGRHHWCAVAPLSRFEIRMEQVQLQVQGDAYHDCNWGVEPLESAFAGWHWSRAALPATGQRSAGTAVLYDTTGRDGTSRLLGRFFADDGTWHAVTDLRSAPLSTTGWRIARATRSDDGHAQVRSTLEDTPFYARSLVDGTWLGSRATAVHESLNLQRFSSPWVRFLLPWRSRRGPPALATGRTEVLA